tara:strand:+ start:1703 stop:2707 length:1005 start_codon:yes stop_codon:yes gene_type:complete
MKTAIVVHGNLRTFLMPTRENPNETVCDNFIRNVVQCNPNADIFMVTDCNDFYYDGSVYWCEGSDIAILNNNAFRLYHDMKIESKERCREIIETELRQRIPNLRGLLVEDPYDCAKDAKYKPLQELKFEGAAIPMLIGQYRKLHTLYKMISEYEEENDFKYETIIKTRYDNYFHAPLVSNSDHNTITTPGYKGDLFSYDWYGMGSRDVMEPFLRMYENLGFTVDYPVWLEECGGVTIHGGVFQKKDFEGINDGCHRADITMSSEYHLGLMINQRGFSKLIGPSVYIYRYLPINSDMAMPILQKNKETLKGASFVNYTPDTTVPNKVNIYDDDKT